MSHLLDRLTYFTRRRERFSGNHGQCTTEDRTWEDAYRNRWQHDKIVRSTHGVNCTGSCSWKIYVKGGIVTWETQQTDYPRTRPDMPNHEPRGCQRGASASWYLYSANRIKYPMIRARLLRLWRAAREAMGPVEAWASIVGDAEKRRDYQRVRGMGGFVRADWATVEEIVAAANVYTIKRYGPDRIYGFSPIPAMSMVSYAAGSRYLSLIGGVCGSFYDWYCDLPPSSPQVWGEQTDVAESAEWFNSNYLIAWGSNVPQTRTPDAHFYTEARYRGAKTVAITPDYAEVAKISDEWLNPKQGTDAALAMAMGHVILREFHFGERRSGYFQDYCRRYTDLPMLVRLKEQRLADGRKVHVADRYLRAGDFADRLGQATNPEWKTVAFEESGALTLPQGSVGFRWGPEEEAGRWNLEERDARTGARSTLALTLIDRHDGLAEVGFPYFGGVPSDHHPGNIQDDVLVRRVPYRVVTVADGQGAESTERVATVYDLLAAHYGIDRGFRDESHPCARSYDDDVPYTPAWQQSITGVPAGTVIRIAREFAENADRTRGTSMIIVGAGLNHWYHMDMHYRGIINMLMLCGCIGVPGGGWAHYVGQEKLRPQTGWTALAFALDWLRPSRQMNSTSFWYAHTDQWRYEKLGVAEILSPLADSAARADAMIDYNVRAERMGWLPSAPQLKTNPLEVCRAADRAGVDPKAFAVTGLRDGTLRLSCEDPDDPDNWPRNLFVWRSNLLGASAKGSEYFIKHLLGAPNGVLNAEQAADGTRPTEVAWHEHAPEGKLDLLVTLDFRMNSTALFSDIVLPAATWYEKNDLNTTDMHPFIHPLSAAVDPPWEARSDWEIFKGFARRFSEVCVGHLGRERDLVLTPLMHDTAAELGQVDVRDWKRGECDLVPGKTAPSLTVVERDYPATHAQFTSLGPLMEQAGNGGKGIAWKTAEEVDALGELNGRVREPGPAQGRPRISTDIEAAETILMLAPETNGHVAVKAWEALSRITGRDHAHLALPKEHEKIRFRDIQAQPRKIITSPTWSGIEDEKICYNAGYTNVHEFIPWRTLTGRQQFYQDHPWMIAFGEGFAAYRPPVNLKAVAPMLGRHGNGQKELVLNWITPHQKWGIHSTYTDNLLMLTLSRGGPCVWIAEDDAKAAGIVDNDWIEVFNGNGAIAARAIVSQRVRPGMAMMYHAQERIVNTPLSSITHARGGIHNAVTRVVVKPTHMIGGYAQLAYGFNYYGTVGSNRDQFCIVRKMTSVEWHADPSSSANAGTAPGGGR
ncbi:MAG: nitrate reductase subunit alpha [Gammaproteobacteria bacterium]|nr:nitrate reductase subunit alpha [Gammaproteobacteria bacterium]